MAMTIYHGVNNSSNGNVNHSKSDQHRIDDGEQDSNSEGANDEDETNDTLDDLDGGEIVVVIYSNNSVKIHLCCFF